MEIVTVFSRWVVLANDDVGDRRAPLKGQVSAISAFSLK